MHFERPFQNCLEGALAAFDISSIARGYVALDAIVKRATVKVESARPISPGRFVITIFGEIAEVQESYSAGLSAAGSFILDHIFLARPHPQLGTRNHARGDATLLGEFNTVPSTLLAADGALKNCDVTLVSMRLADGIGGKGLVVLQGSLCEIEEASAIVKRTINLERIVALETLANPHAEIGGFF